MPSRSSASRPRLFVEPLESRDLLAGLMAGCAVPGPSPDAPARTSRETGHHRHDNLTNSRRDAITQRSQDGNLTPSSRPSLADTPGRSLTAPGALVVSAGEPPVVMLNEPPAPDRGALSAIRVARVAVELDAPPPEPIRPLSPPAVIKEPSPVVHLTTRPAELAIAPPALTHTQPDAPKAEPPDAPSASDPPAEPPVSQAAGLITGLTIDLSSLEDAVRELGERVTFAPGDGSWLSRAIGVGSWALAAALAYAAARQRPRSPLLIAEDNRDNRPA